jgi:hypothetical protein
MLPYSQEAPTGRSQLSIDKAVARLVAAQFQAPKIAVGARYRAMLWAAVPEASIYKYRQA